LNGRGGQVRPDALLRPGAAREEQAVAKFPIVTGAGWRTVQDQPKLEAIKAEAETDADRAEAAIEKLGSILTPEIIERHGRDYPRGMGPERQISSRPCAPSGSARRDAVHYGDQDQGRESRTSAHHGRLGGRSVGDFRSSEF
jgi:hypothetical protein